MTATTLDALLAADLALRDNRLVLADAMEDVERMREAELLRGDEDVVAIRGEILDRQEAMDFFSTDRTAAARVHETTDALQPTAFVDARGCVWDVDIDDMAGSFALSMRHAPNGDTTPFAGVGSWMKSAPFLEIRYARENETFGVGNPDEIVCLGGQWEEGAEAEGDE